MAKDFYNNMNEIRKTYFIDSITPDENDKNFFIMRLLDQEKDVWGNRSFYELISHEFVHKDLIRSYNLENINDSTNGLYDGLFIDLPTETLSSSLTERRVFNYLQRVKKETNNLPISKGVFSGTKLKKTNWHYGIHNALKNYNPIKNNHPELYCVKTGQGDMSLFISSENRAYLIDTNIYSNISSYRLDTLKKILKSRPVEALIITHRHLDHYRGAHYLFESPQFKIKNLIVNPSFVNKKNPVSVSNLLNLAIGYFKQNGGNIISPKNGDCLKDGNTMMHFYVNGGHKNENDNSLFLQITYRDIVYYLTGDIGSRFLEKKAALPPNTNHVVLKVSHHGSATGTSQKFLSKFSSIARKEAFISFGINNRYGLPSVNCCYLLSNNKFQIEESAKMNSSYRKY